MVDVSRPAAAATSAVGLPPAVRLEQSEREFRRVEKAIDGWFSSRLDPDDPRKFGDLHKTRLAALKKVLDDARATIWGAIGEVSVAADRDRGTVYADCQVIDYAIVWVHRVWAYYRDKFDQRDDDALGPTLWAADEVVWSCYRPVFDSKGLPPSIAIGPAPLAFIDSEYSPATWEAGKQPPTGLREDTQIEGLAEFLATLPIPILRLPPWSIDAPWWLVFVAHEVGHNLQRELRLNLPFRSAITRAWDDGAQDAAERRERWIQWEAEIFADLVSVAMIGPWAIRGLREIVLGPATTMASPTVGYPPPIVRLTLMAKASKELGFGDVNLLAGLDPAASIANEAVKRDLADVDAVLKQALGPLNASKSTVAGICRTDLVLAGLASESNKAADSLPTVPGAPARSFLRPRYVLCGAFTAWERAASKATVGERSTKLDGIAANAIAALRISGPQDTRAVEVAPVVGGQGRRLAEWLLGQGRKQPAVED